MIYRTITTVFLFGCLLLMTGCCACANREGPAPEDGEQLPLSEKKPKEMQSLPPKADDAEKYVPGQVLVKLKAGMELAGLESITEELGLKIIEPLSMPGMYLMKITGDETIETVIKQLESYDAVEYGEPNFITKTQ